MAAQGTQSSEPPGAGERASFHAGRLLARRLRAHGVSRIFTLSGGHLFSVYDGCRAEGIAIVDVRHEQTAGFAAEGWAKVTREPGVCALTAGPGVTNGMSAMGSAQANHSPMVVLGGRAPAGRWGQGSLQEIDHVPFVAPLCKLARTARSAQEIPDLVEAALAAAREPHGGAAFVDLPLDYVFMEAEERSAARTIGAAVGESSAAIGAGNVGGARAGGGGKAGESSAAAGAGDAGGPSAAGLDEALEVAGRLLGEAERPVVMAGTDLYWGRGEGALLALLEELRIPVYLNGLARGCVPADHELFFSRTRSQGLGEADVALVVGVPMDFRLGFGGAFGEDTKIVVLDGAPPKRVHPRPVAAELYGAMDVLIGEVCARARARTRRGQKIDDEGDGWLARLRTAEDARREAEREELEDEREPLHPMRIYAELGRMLDRDAIVIGDGGDFVSYAGRVIDSYEPGCWLDPGPFGCLGSGPGYALAAKLAHPERQVVLLLGDGAFGFAGIEFDTLARHGVDVVGVMGNNGIWGLEKHPMEFLYGYSVAADLRPGTRYDTIVQTLGGHGELVRHPGELQGALERALSAGRPALVNVLTDPGVAYPRRSNLA